MCVCLLNCISIMLFFLSFTLSSVFMTAFNWCFYSRFSIILFAFGSIAVSEIYFAFFFLLTTLCVVSSVSSHNFPYYCQSSNVSTVDRLDRNEKQLELSFCHCRLQSTNRQFKNTILPLFETETLSVFAFHI